MVGGLWVRVWLEGWMAWVRKGVWGLQLGCQLGCLRTTNMQRGRQSPGARACLIDKAGVNAGQAP